MTKDLLSSPYKLPLDHQGANRPPLYCWLLFYNTVHHLCAGLLSQQNLAGD